MLQVGQGHVKLEKARETGKGLLSAENRLLKQTIGLIWRGPQFSQQAQEPEPIMEQAVESQDDPEDDLLEDDPSGRGSAQPRG